MTGTVYYESQLWSSVSSVAAAKRFSKNFRGAVRDGKRFLREKRSESFVFRDVEVINKVSCTEVSEMFNRISLTLGKDVSSKSIN